MGDLVAGANMVLPNGSVSVALSGPYDLSALVLGANGKVGGDADFVFYNQPSAPGVRLDSRANTQTVTVEPTRLRPGATRVVLVASPEQAGMSFGQLRPPGLTASDRGGRQLARIQLSSLRNETAAQLAEIYRRDPGWKLRAIAQGYADGLAGIARDFGVDVVEDNKSPATIPPNSAPPQVIRWTAQPLAPPPTPAPAPPSAAPPPADMLREVVTLTNAERTRHGKRPLAYQHDLAKAAQAHSQDMMVRDFFNHQNPDGAQVWDRVLATGYAYRKVAENIAAGQRSPAEVVRGWMESPGHRRNILDGELTQIGVGLATGGSYLTYWTQVFGTPR